MWFIFWKKYEGSWLATAISFAGFFLILIAAFFFGLAMEKAFQLEPGGIVEILIMLAAAVVLKIGLNLLTNQIAKIHLSSQVDRSVKRWDKEQAKKQEKREQALAKLQTVTDSEELLAQLLKVWPLVLSNSDLLNEAARLDDAHLLQLISTLKSQWKMQENRPRYYRKEGGLIDSIHYQEASTVVGLIGKVRDGVQREKLSKEYAFCYAAMSILRSSEF